ncbi:hypothetical protein T11_15860 [Trichinella zimbabwensis]|uniref:Uncharacterized protein n=1 Tax=Trichinella zimbabwensis TaxID=268475 RepID=A0A0V1GJF8_9BILA|nr:hypothetical protein T11_15860 [Trichinella zimbabwensis]
MIDEYDLMKLVKFVEMRENRNLSTNVYVWHERFSVSSFAFAGVVVANVENCEQRNPVAFETYLSLRLML